MYRHLENLYAFSSVCTPTCKVKIISMYKSAEHFFVFILLLSKFPFKLDPSNCHLHIFYNRQQYVGGICTESMLKFVFDFLFLFAGQNHLFWTFSWQSPSTNNALLWCLCSLFNPLSSSHNFLFDAFPFFIASAQVIVSRECLYSDEEPRNVSSIQWRPPVQPHLAFSIHWPCS